MKMRLNKLEKLPVMKMITTVIKMMTALSSKRLQPCNEDADYNRIKQNNIEQKAIDKIEKPQTGFSSAPSHRDDSLSTSKVRTKREYYNGLLLANENYERKLLAEQAKEKEKEKDDFDLRQVM